MKLGRLKRWCGGRELVGRCLRAALTWLIPSEPALTAACVMSRLHGWKPASLKHKLLSFQPNSLLFKVVDYRHHDNPHQQLEGLQAEQGLQIWSEADALHIPGSHDRYNLQPCRLLAIWTTPPGRAELQAALTSASPQIIYLFGIDPPTSRLETFLKHLVGLVKIHHQFQGRVHHPASSGSCHSPATSSCPIGIGLAPGMRRPWGHFTWRINASQWGVMVATWRSRQSPCL